MDGARAETGILGQGYEDRWRLLRLLSWVAGDCSERERVELICMTMCRDTAVTVVITPNSCSDSLNIKICRFLLSYCALLLICSGSFYSAAECARASQAGKLYLNVLIISDSSGLLSTTIIKCCSFLKRSKRRGKWADSRLNDFCQWIVVVVKEIVCFWDLIKRQQLFSNCYSEDLIKTKTCQPSGGQKDQSQFDKSSGQLMSHKGNRYNCHKVIGNRLITPRRQ